MLLWILKKTVCFLASTKKTTLSFFYFQEKNPCFYAKNNNSEEQKEGPAKEKRHGEFVLESLLAAARSVLGGKLEKERLSRIKPFC
ncbi:MAG: hypothetical protein Q8P67_19380 [archaeon]|nr:hypothetical protein [archaeon]